MHRLRPDGTADMTLRPNQIFTARLRDDARRARMLDTVPGVAGLEVNISCPNVAEGGAAFGADASASAAVTSAVKKATSLPVMVKLTPNVTDIVQVAKAVEEAGADYVDVARRRGRGSTVRYPAP